MRIDRYTSRIYGHPSWMDWDFQDRARIPRRKLEEYKRTRKIWEEDESLESREPPGLLDSQSENEPYGKGKDMLPPTSRIWVLI